MYDYGIMESWEREKGDEGALISVRWSRVSMLFRNKLLLCRTGRLSVHRGADRGLVGAYVVYVRGTV